MFSGNERKTGFYAVAGGGLIAFLAIISMMLNIIGSNLQEPSMFFGGVEYLFDIIIPVLLIGELVLLFKTPGNRKYSGKWWYVAATILYMLAIRSFSYLLNCFTSLICGDPVSFINFCINILSCVGFSILAMTLFEEKFRNFELVGLGIIGITKLLDIIEQVDSVTIMHIFPVVTIILLFIIALGNENKILRTLAVIAAVFTVIFGRSSVNILEFIVYIILAYLMVPAGKVKLDFYFIPGIAFLLMAIAALGGFGHLAGFTQFLVLLVFIVAPLILSICFFAKRFGKLAITGYILMFVSLIISGFYNSGIYAFNQLIDTITFTLIVKTIALVLFGLIFFNLESDKNAGRKIWLIVLSVFIGLSVLSTTDYGYMDYYYENYKVFDLQNILNILFAVSMFVSALVLVPFRFTKYQGIGKHIFLSLITCGIWHFIWVYNVTKNLEIVDKDRKGKYAVELLLYIFIPMYYIYWYYKAAYATDKYAQANGIESRNGIMVFLLCLVSPLISSVLIQSKFNAVETK